MLILKWVGPIVVVWMMIIWIIAMLKPQEPTPKLDPNTLPPEIRDEVYGKKIKGETL